MRLPEDTDEAVALVRQAIDSGTVYIDTSRGYGDSEIKLGKALKDGYREKVLLSTKWSPWIVKYEDSDDTSSDCMRKRIEESMKRLDVDYLDFYQVWNIDSREHYDQAIAKGGMVDGIRKAMDDGLVGHTGFTTHDSVENLLTYIEEAEWCEIILFTYNLLNKTYAPAIDAAHKKGIGTVIMNPVGGGMLTQQSAVLAELVEAAGAASLPDLAIRYLLSNPSIDTIISGFSKPLDIIDSISSAERPKFSPEKMSMLRERLDAILQGCQAFCTGCKYCMPCPQGIDIPSVLYGIGQERFWGFEKHARDHFARMNTPGAEACTACSACEEKCTQHLRISEEMTYAADKFGK
jgi:predicted aldo/keto reductase-like oxidoreductase